MTPTPSASALERARELAADEYGKKHKMYPQLFPRDDFYAGFDAGLAEGLSVAEGLELALRTLRNEVKGTLHAHQYAIQYDHGNSNWRCLEMALERAETELANFRARKEGK